MDAESSYESDISESWSLIDINLNEESIAAEALSILECEKPLLSDEKNVELKKSESLDLENFIDQNKSENETACNKVNNFDSDLPFQIQELIISDRERIDYDESNSSQSSEEKNKNDSGDTESIEILDGDENYRDTDIDKLDISFIDGKDCDVPYHLDDNSFYEVNINNDIDKTSSVVLKRKKRKLRRHSDSSQDSVNCDCMCNEKFYLDASVSETRKSNEKEEEQSCKSNTQPVYKHYRNNVANTVLSLSMGVMFAAVACIAIGHFLGVHDVGETTLELLEKLKKLDLENMALQSRLSHLNKGYNRGTNSKNKIPLNDVNYNFFCDKKSEKVENAEVNHPALSNLQSRANSFEWISKLQNLMQTKSHCLNNNDNGIDLNKIVTNIHDQLVLLNSKSQDARLKNLEESDTKISKMLKKITDQLSSSQDNIEFLYQRLLKLKNKLNKKLSKLFLEENFREIAENSSKKFLKSKKIPVEKNDLLSIEWEPQKKEAWSHNLVVAYPQPEKYYKIENNNSLKFENHSKNEIIEVTNVSENRSQDEFKIKEKRKKFKNVSEKNKKELKIGKQRKIENTEKKSKERKNDHKKSKHDQKGQKYTEGKRRKRESNNFNIRNEKKTERLGKNKKKSFQAKQNNVNYFFKKNKSTFNETKYQNKKYFRMEKFVKKMLKDFKPKRNTLKKKNIKSKYHKKFLSSLLANSFVKKNKNENFCSTANAGWKYDPKCFNLTGHWVFKWANGRQEFRRHQAIGDWQFERAKKRKELRDHDFSPNWQFERAKGRREMRNEDFVYDWQLKKPLIRENSQNEFRYYYNKNNNRGEYFHLHFP